MRKFISFGWPDAGWALFCVFYGLSVHAKPPAPGTAKDSLPTSISMAFKQANVPLNALLSLIHI
jgi:hypothetical protein